ncbi:MAG: flavodoxin family protein [Coriobacteriia bacterium]|nr:flavodoxin family protein [Coriobacteriia bacterium]
MQQMPKKVVIIQGSPRRRGNSALLADTLATGIEAAFGPDSASHVQIEIRDVAQMKIAPCRGCNVCLDLNDCVIDDSFEELMAAVEGCDLLIWSNPIFFGAIPSQAKAIVDRFQLLWARNVRAGRPKGFAADRSRPALALFVATHDDIHASERKNAAATTPLRYMTQVAGFTLQGQHAFVGPEKPGDILQPAYQQQIDAAIQDAVALLKLEQA